MVDHKRSFAYLRLFAQVLVNSCCCLCGHFQSRTAARQAFILHLWNWDAVIYMACTWYMLHPKIFCTARPIYKAGLNFAELFCPSKGQLLTSEHRDRRIVSPFSLTFFISVLILSGFYSYFIHANTICLCCLKEKVEREIKWRLLCFKKYEKK